MAIKMNLLPPEYGATKGLGKLLKSVRTLGIVSIAVFLVFALGISAFFIISSVTLNNLNSNLDSLKVQITSQQASEQQIVLLKDRLAKIKLALNSPSANKNLAAIYPYVSGLPGDASLSEFKLDSTKADITVVFRSNDQLTSFLQKLGGSKDFNSVSLTSFVYSPESGYSVGISAGQK